MLSLKKVHNHGEKQFNH